MKISEKHMRETVVLLCIIQFLFLLGLFVSLNRIERIEVFQKEQRETAVQVKYLKGLLTHTVFDSKYSTNH